MLTLLLMRHAKSSWVNPGQLDFDRPLAKRGQAAAPEIGAWIAGHDLKPDLVVCSPAVRTRETLKLMLPQLGTPAPRVEIDEELYLASPAEMLERLHALGPEPRRVMLVAHNPGLQALASALAGRGPKAARSELAIKFPTAALAVLTFEASAWTDVRANGGELLHFITPRTLD